jgi:hypothetical protein
MSEPLADRLKQFTPDGATLDRDALLFHAGRASARAPRGWKLLAATLAAGQIVTLALLWPRPVHETVSPVVEPSRPPAEQIVPEHSVDPSEWLVLDPRAMGLHDSDLPAPAPVGPLVPDAPPLRVSSPVNDLLTD